MEFELIKVNLNGRSRTIEHFIPTASAIPPDFWVDLGYPQNNVTVCDGSYRHIYIIRVIIARKYFQGGV